MIPVRSLWPVLSLTLFAGCAQMGPKTVPVARLHYSEAIIRSGNEQMLLNLVRLRYRDTPMFLEVGSIVTSFSVERSAAASLGANTDDLGAADVGLSAGFLMSESPTVTYTPVQGEAFVQRLLAPIPPADLMLFSQTGWSIERLLLCCVQRLNLLRNAPTAAGPTPDYVPDYKDFHEVAHLLRDLQKASLLDLELAEKGGAPYLTLVVPPGHPLAGEAARVRQLLLVDPTRNTFQVTSSLKQKGADEIAMMGRSLLSVLFFLSQAVEVPQAHRDAGWVTLTHGENGDFNWAEVTGNLLRVRTSPDEPKNAAVAVRYRGHWFYIADDDLNSKTTFGLLNYLYALKAGTGGVKEPVLTLGLN